MPPMTDIQAVSGATPIGRPSNVIHVVLRNAVCARCNNRWMSDLEKSFVNTLGTQLSTPKARRLDPSQQERIARWAVKTALLMTLWTSVQSPTATQFGYYVPDADLRWFPNNTTPPPRTRVWIGAVHDPGHRAAHLQSAALSVEMTKPIAYFVTLSLGYLLFQVFGTQFTDMKDPSTGRESPAIDPPPPLNQALTNIWPGNGHDSVWPPSATIPSATLDNVSEWPAQLIRRDGAQPYAPGRWAVRPSVPVPPWPPSTPIP